LATSGDARPKYLFTNDQAYDVIMATSEASLLRNFVADQLTKFYNLLFWVRYSANTVMVAH